MKKALCRILLLLIVCQVVICVFVASLTKKGYGYTVVSCVSCLPAKVDMVGMEDTVMQIVYQLARRNIVKVMAKDYAGSGIIWEIDGDIVIVSNRHLLMNDVKVKVSLGSGDVVDAEVLGYSQQYDIAFAVIPETELNDTLIRDIYEATPVIYDTETDEGREGFEKDYIGKRVMQVGVNMDESKTVYYTGTVEALEYIPFFNTFIVEARCHSKAGMSGGGMFNSEGKFIAMISGGDVDGSTAKKEADMTYAIPASLIQQEYNNFISERQ
jgi:S1-C subfamily serine protease